MLVRLLSPASAQPTPNPPTTRSKAFDAAKELGTVEAWDAFLANYPKGFHADLARAYVKKLAEPPAYPEAPLHAVAPPVQHFDYPMVAGTWGGIVRRGPSQGDAKVASLREGEEVTLMAPPLPATMNDYPWFKIAFRSGSMGYMWGGLLCSTGAERPDLYKLCTFTPYRDTSSEYQAPARPVVQEIASRARRSLVVPFAGQRRRARDLRRLRIVEPRRCSECRLPAREIRQPGFGG